MPRSLFSNNARVLAVSAALTETERVIEKTRRDALELFRARGEIDRASLAKWLSDVRDACWRITDIVEREDSFVISIALPTADHGLVQLTREPRRLVIRAGRGPEREASKVVRRLDLPVDLSSERVEAELRDGALVITLPKAESSIAR